MANKRKYCNSWNQNTWYNPAKRIKISNGYQQQPNPIIFNPPSPYQHFTMPTPNNNFNPYGGHSDVIDNEAVYALYQHQSNVIYNLEQNFEGFVVMSVLINGIKYFGTGTTLQIAKNVAAEAAIKDLKEQSEHFIMNVPGTTNTSVGSIADRIGNIVHDKFYELAAQRTGFQEIGVLAGIVMTINSDISTARVVAFASGTKCVNGEYISCNGCVINDSHAEIVARRCLVDYFYSQLDKLTVSNKVSIFYDPNPQSSIKKFKLKKGIDFHLFISTAPCGDARIMRPLQLSINENYVPVNGDSTSFKVVRGMLRHKVEKRPGTFPVNFNYCRQTWDGILQGQQLLTMSCSDKIAKWNVLGLQGTLLSSVLEPVYLSSITLGNEIRSTELICSALGGRIGDGLNTQKLPPQYYLNEPLVAQVTQTGPNLPVVTPHYSVNWTIGQYHCEIVQSFTGKKMNGAVSRLAKQTFFKRFAKLAKNYNLSHYYNDNKFYGEVKESIKHHKRAKEILYDAFAKQGFGVWLKKPLEQDEFTVLSDNAIVEMISFKAAVLALNGASAIQNLSCDVPIKTPEENVITIEDDEQNIDEQSNVVSPGDGVTGEQDLIVFTDVTDDDEDEPDESTMTAECENEKPSGEQVVDLVMEDLTDDENLSLNWNSSVEPTTDLSANESAEDLPEFCVFSDNEVDLESIIDLDELSDIPDDEDVCGNGTTTVTELICDVTDDENDTGIWNTAKKYGDLTKALSEQGNAEDLIEFIDITDEKVGEPMNNKNGVDEKLRLENAKIPTNENVTPATDETEANNWKILPKSSTGEAKIDTNCDVNATTDATGFQLLNDASNLAGNPIINHNTKNKVNDVLAISEESKPIVKSEGVEDLSNFCDIMDCEGVVDEIIPENIAKTATGSGVSPSELTNIKAAADTKVDMMTEKTIENQACDFAMTNVMTFTINQEGISRRSNTFLHPHLSSVEPPTNMLNFPAKIFKNSSPKVRTTVETSESMEFKQVQLKVKPTEDSLEINVGKTDRKFIENMLLTDTNPSPSTNKTLVIKREPGSQSQAIAPVASVKIEKFGSSAADDVKKIKIEMATYTIPTIISGRSGKYNKKPIILYNLR